MNYEDISAEIKEYNNKSRKGKYVYVKSPGNRGQAFKWDGTQEQIKGLKQYYLRTRMKGYKAKLAKRKPIKTYPLDSIGKGITLTSITDVHRATTQDVNKARNDLIIPLIKDSKLTDLWLQKSNFDKLQNRMEYKLVCYDENNSAIFSLEKYNGAIEKALQEAKQIYKGTTVEELSEKQTIAALGREGWLNPKVGTGIIARVELEITLRKGI